MKTNRRPTRYLQTLLYLLLLVGVIVAMSMTKRCSSSAPLPPVTSGHSGADTIDVAVMYGPMSYFMYGDTLGGVNLDMLKAYQNASGKKLKFWPIVNLHDALDKLENGTFDILASLPADNGVKSRFATTESVFLDRLVLVQLMDSAGSTRVKSALDLNGDTIVIQKDSPAASRLSNLSNEIGGNINVVKDERLSEEYLCMKVASGEIPLVVVNEKIAEKMKLTYPALSYDNPVSFTQFQVWLMPKGDTLLLNNINAWLSDFLKTPAYHDIIKKYSTNSSPSPAN